MIGIWQAYAGATLIVAGAAMVATYQKPTQPYKRMGNSVGGSAGVDEEHGKQQEKHQELRDWRCVKSKSIYRRRYP